MPKVVIDNFSGGQSPTDRDKTDGRYAVGYGIDIHRDFGYIRPAYMATDITPTDMTQVIVDICPYNGKAFLLGTNWIWGISDVTTNTFYNNSAGFVTGGVGHGYYNTGNSNVGESLAIYQTKIAAAAAADKLFYFYNITGGGGAFGMYDLVDTFDDDWSSTVPAGAAALENAPHPNLPWNSMLWFGNGRYLGKFNGNLGDNGTLSPQFFDLGVGWIITSLFTSQNFLGICAYKPTTAGEYGESAVFFYDGSAQNWSYKVQIKAERILSSTNSLDGVHLTIRDNNGKLALIKLSDSGYSKIQDLSIEVSGVKYNFENTKGYKINLYNERLLIPVGRNTTSAVPFGLMQYGRINADSPLALFTSHLMSTTDSSSVGAANVVGENIIYLSGSVGTTEKIYAISGVIAGNNTATYKGNYSDFGQNVRINYIKVYFKPLISGNRATVGLDIDYGSSLVLGIGSGNINYGNDAAITKKRWDIKRLCHSFRPTIEWLSGGVSISKIVIDYDFVDDI